MVGRGQWGVGSELCICLRARETRRARSPRGPCWTRAVCGCSRGPPNPRSGHVRALPLDSANPLTPLGGRCSRPPARSQAGVQTTSLGTGGAVSAGCRARHPHTFPTAPSHSSREQKSRGSPTSFVSALQRHRAASSHETPPPWVPLSVDAWKRGCARLRAASCGVLPAARGARCRAVSTLPGVPCLHARRPPPPSAPVPLIRADPHDAKTRVHASRQPRDRFWGAGGALGPAMANGQTCTCVWPVLRTPGRHETVKKWLPRPKTCCRFHLNP